MFGYPSPAWKTRAVRHSAVRTKRQSSHRRRKTASDPLKHVFIGQEYYNNGAPKNRRGQRLRLELTVEPSSESQ